jgi:hypothetical protein
MAEWVQERAGEDGGVWLGDRGVHEHDGESYHDDGHGPGDDVEGD